MFQSVLVANRGEIALRVISSLQDHGIEAVLVASDPDLNSVPAKRADRIIHLPGTSVLETYLNMDLIVDEAKNAGVHAIHPGYGFLAENPSFASLVEKAGITFIGPTPEQMQTFGDKITARKLAKRTDTPVIEGTDGDLSNEEIRDICRQIGYPILIKATAGGGGRGIRIVHSENELDEQLNNARTEAKLAFNDDRIFIEKFIANGRHIEVQILGLGNGEVLHFGERDCTMQRKNQKLIEEAPAPTISREKASEIHQAALNLTSEIGYRNAGTVEFLLDNTTHEFYFLEVNARIQVEHPVTEMITGEDLVWKQIQVAAGVDLDVAQSDLRIKGHAIEARVYAENPYKGFLPSPGKIRRIIHPIGSGIRVDTAVMDSDVITPYYDPMISKLIAHAPNRQAAIRKLSTALNNYLISGVHTTVAYIRDLINHPNFISGDYHTKFLDTYKNDIPGDILSIAQGIAAFKFAQVPASGNLNQRNGVSMWRTSTWPRERW